MRIECNTTGEVATSYKGYLRTECWKRRRAFRLDDVDLKAPCPVCGQVKKYWEVAHLNLERLGCERSFDTQAMCRACWGKHNERLGLMSGTNVHGRCFPPKEKLDYKFLQSVS